MIYYLAIDLGASSGRCILSHIENKNIISEEIYRFENKMISIGDKLIWDIDKILKNIVTGLKLCKKLGKAPKFVGIDSFGVDYCLLDKTYRIIGDVYAYRDNRTIEPMKEFHKNLSMVDYYKISGVQPKSYNTLYQLYSDKLSGKIESAKHIVMLPSYINYFLTGILKNERTILSTSGLLDISNGNYSVELLSHMHLSKDQFPEIVDPGTALGKVKTLIARRIGYTPTVIAVCQHDTASAVLGSFASDSTIFLSSGTWSLLGILTQKKITNSTAFKFGFTNESSYRHENRFLKNIMGLWIVQQFKQENHPFMSFEEIVAMATVHSDYDELIDVNDITFLSPKSMTQAITNYIKTNQMKTPKHIWQVYYMIYNSLAYEYSKAIYDLECITGSKFENINIVGGGSKNPLLNNLTAKYSKKKIIDGPVEATALGNVIVQMIYNNDSQICIGNKNLYIKNSLNK